MYIPCKYKMSGQITRPQKKETKKKRKKICIIKIGDHRRTNLEKRDQEVAEKKSDRNRTSQLR